MRGGCVGLDSPQRFHHTPRPKARTINSSVNSDESAAKLFTNLSGFLISCPMPAMSCPSAAIFWARTRLACAVCNSRKG